MTDRDDLNHDTVIACRLVLATLNHDDAAYETTLAELGCPTCSHRVMSMLAVIAADALVSKMGVETIVKHLVDNGCAGAGPVMVSPSACRAQAIADVEDMLTFLLDNPEDEP